MVAPNLVITENLRLITPNPNRDAPTSVEWRSGITGHKTQAAMGIPLGEIRTPTLEDERSLLQSLIDSQDVIIWMIEHENTVVGVVEVALRSTEYENAPSISVMIGDTAARGQQVGTKVMKAGIQFLHRGGHKTVHARHLVENVPSARMLQKIGFIKTGSIYTDNDDLRWQNVEYRLEEQ